jgi:hypothetical protein
MNAVQFIQCLNSPGTPDVSLIPVVKDLLKKYPFAASLHMLYIKLLKNSADPEFEKYIETAAIYINDRKKLYRYINDIPEDVVVQQHISEYKLESIDDEISEVSNPQIDLINKFLDKKPVFKIKNIDDFEPEEPAYDPEIVSETLAEIYHKQGKTSLAINTYEKLCLKFPEKNSYFAARIEKILKES